MREGDGEIDAEVEIGGTVASRQGLNVPGPGVDILPAVPEEDLAHLQAGIQIGVDLVALSFVRRPEDVTFVREHTRIPLIAKIEKPQAVDNAEEILRVSDCVMVARGDLGIELPIEEVPVVQKRLIALAGALARPSITATQMLDSMVSASRPTRAEVADVANAILDGTDAVMLSQETAVGAYPVGCDRDDGRDRAPDGEDRALRALERDARAPRRARPVLHRRPRRCARPRATWTSTRSSSRRSAAAACGWSARTARPCRSTRSRPGARPCAAAALMWGVRSALDAPPRGDRGR